MGMARGETSGDRGAHRARGEPVAALAISAARAYAEHGDVLRRHLGVASRRAAELARRDVAPSPEEELLEREAARAITGRLAALPEHARLALVLAAHGFGGAEIARRIGRSEPATRSILCRSRSRLRADPAA